jgi:hypothetical protein
MGRPLAEFGSDWIFSLAQRAGRANKKGYLKAISDERWRPFLFWIPQAFAEKFYRHQRGDE